MLFNHGVLGGIVTKRFKVVVAVVVYVDSFVDVTIAHLFLCSHCFVFIVAVFVLLLLLLSYCCLVTNVVVLPGRNIVEGPVTLFNTSKPSL